MTAPPPTDRQRLSSYVETWHRACADFVTLARSVPRDQWDLPTDLAGWSVKDVVAHTAHLEAVLAGAPEETIEITPSAHVRGPMGVYTEQGVRAREAHPMDRLVEEIERSVARRHQALLADPPLDPGAPPPRTPGGIGWDTATLLRNRPLDVWMHEQDIRRAIDRPGDLDSPAARHTVEYLLGSLGMVVGKRVAPPPGTSVTMAVPELDLQRSVRVAADGRALPETPPDARDDAGDATARIELATEAFVVLAGGRRDPAPGEVRISGDAALAERVLAAMGVTP